MAGLVPAIHVLLVAAKTWMPGTRPGMTMLKQGLPGQLFFSPLITGPKRSQVSPLKRII
jgi:hypothetical protein